LGGEAHRSGSVALGRGHINHDRVVARHPAVSISRPGMTAEKPDRVNAKINEKGAAEGQRVPFDMISPVPLSSPITPSAAGTPVEAHGISVGDAGTGVAPGEHFEGRGGSETGPEGDTAGMGGTPGNGNVSGDRPHGHMKQHFIYIRELIHRNLKYPSAARRLAWKGTTVVSFVILENGMTEHIQVIKSSGYEMLDQAVVKTIQRLQPFPEPPVKAHLTIPIVFQIR
ncbi:MAG: energy transducer TonB, partial [Nitrospirae bacterium]|nr:energy transducer TonB [Nitrospirota bacterium]